MEQVEGWFLPLVEDDFKNRSILELGCGNGSLLVHILKWGPKEVVGVDLGESVVSCKKNLEKSKTNIPVKILQEDLIEFTSEKFDITYSIGVLHHLEDPYKGFKSVIKNTKPGGKFHCWVYAREGNNLIVWIVDPIRKIVSNFPWRITKYFVATPLVIPYFIYSKLISKFQHINILKKLPPHSYSCWISKRNFNFYQHVAFDQLVTPQTVYISRQTIEKWLESISNIKQNSTYIVFRNGNSWKFGGVVNEE